MLLEALRNGYDKAGGALDDYATAQTEAKRLVGEGVRVEGALGNLIRHIADPGLLLLPAAVAACEKESQPMTLRSDKDLDAKLADLRNSGGSAPLRTLTSFEWDTVYCYYEGAPADEVNRDVGTTVLKPGSRLMVTGALAVFSKDGEVVKALVIPELTFTPASSPTVTPSWSKRASPSPPRPSRPAPLALPLAILASCGSPRTLSQQESWCDRSGRWRGSQ